MLLAALVVAGEDDLSLQEVGEFFDEGVVLNGEAFRVGDEVVVRQHGRYRREQADGGGNQRFGDARRDAGDAGALCAADGDEGVHDAVHGAEQADVGRG